MEITLRLYNYVDGINDTPFPNKEEQAMFTFTYDANRMAGSPTINATVKHRLCLDDLWTDNVYAEFRGEKYFVMNTPSSSKDNEDERYEHDVELLSEREVLNHIYFIDAVQGDSEVDVYKSNTTKVQFMGNIKEFVSRLNSCFSYHHLDYIAVIDDGITSEDKLVSFEDKYILEALQEIFNIYEIPYYFVGKVVHIGYTENAITLPLKYGFDGALLSISKENANYQVINKIKGTGSSDNIPYYYPNESDDREAIEASGKKWITPTTNLMPSIYRETEGAEMFYEAKNNTYPDGEGGYYEFENEYSDRNQKQGTTTFEEIKPTIKEMTNASGQRIDMFTEFAYDLNDNDETDEDGNYLHPYFFAKLRKFDGEFGFNLFDHAIESQTMQFSFTSGVCGACSFELGVGEETNKNIVQVDDDGNLKRDEDGNVLWENQTPQDRQNDTQKYEVWIALKKDDSTYGQIMPNKSQNLRPSTDDTFVILGIDLPLSYVKAAEKKLEDSLIKYMWMNNKEKFTFSIKFSRIFFTEHPEVLEKLNENARLIIEYNGQQHTLYVDSFTYKTDESSPLPEIEVNLVDTLTIGQNSLQNALDSVKQDILSSIGGGDFLKQGLKYFLRKDVNDTARGKIIFKKGLEAGDFAQGSSGVGVYQDENGNWHIESDYLNVRMKFHANEIEIQKMYHIGGAQIKSSASMKCVRVEETSTSYKCYMNTKGDDGDIIYNQFRPLDQAIVRTFNVEQKADGTFGNHFLWRLVTAVGENYIELSKTVCAENSDTPRASDDIVQLGYQGTDDTSRQVAVIDAGAGDGAPYYRQYTGINSFTLPEPETQLKPGNNVLSGIVHIQNGSTGAGNIDDLPEEIQKVAQIGSVNLLLNSGFTGGYQSEELDEINPDTELYSKKLKDWEGTATIQEDTESVSGMSALVGNLSQPFKLPVKLINDESYVISYKAKGRSVVFTCGNFGISQELTGAYQKYSHKFTFSGEQSFALKGDATICDLQLERGTVATDWKPSPRDNNISYEKFQLYQYLIDAIKNGSVDILGGLILASIIQLGNYKDEKMQKVTAGLSGIYNDDDDVYTWGGGTLEQAIKTVLKYKENPQYQPTEEELANMVKAVITHGGRAILNDAIVRGTIYAKDGIFSGTVKSSEGNIGNWIISNDLNDESFVSPVFKKEEIDVGVGRYNNYYVSNAGKGSLLSTKGFIFNGNNRGISNISGYLQTGLITAFGSVGQDVKGLSIYARQTDTVTGNFQSVTALELDATNAFTEQNPNSPAYQKPTALKVRHGFVDVPGIRIAGKVIDNGSAGISSTYKFGQYKGFTVNGESVYSEFVVTKRTINGFTQYDIQHNLGTTNYVCFFIPLLPNTEFRKIHAIVLSEALDVCSVAFIDSGTANSTKECSFNFVIIGDN